MSSLPISLSKGDTLFQQAIAYRDSLWSYFTGDTNKEQAAELFAQAGAQYKLAKNYFQAGEAYTEAAKCLQKVKGSGGEASQYWNDAGQCYKKIPDGEAAVKCFEMAIGYHVDGNQFAQAAKLYQELGDMFVAEHNAEQAIHFYEQAADHYSNSNSNTASMANLIKAADLYATLKEYAKAIGIYEKVANGSMNDLGKWSIKDYYFKAVLCLLAQEKQFVSPVEKAETAFRKYCDDFPQFETTREAVFLGKLLDVLKDEDGDLSENLARIFIEYEKISKFPVWHANLISIIKKNFLEGVNDDQGIPYYLYFSKSGIL